jgi:hypothetical protein
MFSQEKGRQNINQTMVKGGVRNDQFKNLYKLDSQQSTQNIRFHTLTLLLLLLSSSSSVKVHEVQHYSNSIHLIMVVIKKREETNVS